MERKRRKRSDTKKERNEAVFQLWKQGYSVYEVGSLFDLTGQRVHQIVKSEMEALDKDIDND